MTENINIQNKMVIPEQVTPTLKISHPSNNSKEEKNTVQLIAATRSKKPEKEIENSNTDKIEETAEEKEASEQALDSAVKQLNSYVQSINRNLEFNIDNDSGKTVVKVIDAETDELIRQIPNEEALIIARQLDTGLDDDTQESKLFLIRAKA